MDDASAFRFRDDGADFIIRDAGGFLALPAHQAQHGLRGDVQQPDRRGGDARERDHHGRENDGEAFRIAQGHALGNQFADDEEI